MNLPKTIIIKEHDDLDQQRQVFQSVMDARAPKLRHNVKVTFADGDVIYTTINGTEEEIRDYYLNNEFNIGAVEDNVQRAVQVEFLS